MSLLNHCVLSCICVFLKGGLHLHCESSKCGCETVQLFLAVRDPPVGRGLWGGTGPPRKGGYGTLLSTDLRDPPLYDLVSKPYLNRREEGPVGPQK